MPSAVSQEKARCLQDPTPLIWKVSRLSQTSLGISLGYLLLDAMLVAWYLPAVGLVLVLLLTLSYLSRCK